MTFTQFFLPALFLALLRAAAWAADGSTQCSDCNASTLHGRLIGPSPYSNKDGHGNTLLFFLHQPRTGGRTLSSCLLRKAFESENLLMCPRSYDLLRLDVKNVPCRFLSHDDFSIVPTIVAKAKPPINVAVVTHIRDPLDRFISSYEFGVLNSAREVSKTMFGPQKKKKEKARTLTSNVYPWSKLIPFFVRDMTMRRSRGFNMTGLSSHWIEIEHQNGSVFYHNSLGISKWNLTADDQKLLLPPLDPYDNPLVMSLSEFSRHPIATDLLHNGQTFQVLGITNYSHWGDAGEFRQCLGEDASQFLQLATSLLERFAHVGSTEKLELSTAIAAGILGFDLSSPANDGDETSLGGAYQACQMHAQVRQMKRRNEFIKGAYLPDGRSLTFRSPGRRSGIKEATIQCIRSRNFLDEQLLKRAHEILAKNQRRFPGELKKLQTANSMEPKPESKRVFNLHGQQIKLPM